MSCHNNLVLFVAFIVYVYRDIWPLATCTEKPIDDSEDTLLWTKVIVLFGTAVVIPLLVPRRYVPVDPKVIVPSSTLALLTVHSIPWKFRTPSRHLPFFLSFYSVLWTLSSPRPVKFLIYRMSDCLSSRITIVLNTFARRPSR